MLKTLTFRLYVLFGTHTLLYRSLRVLQFPTHLPKLKVHQCRFENLPIRSDSYKKEALKVSHS